MAATIGDNGNITGATQVIETPTGIKTVQTEGGQYVGEEFFQYPNAPKQQQQPSQSPALPGGLQQPSQQFLKPIQQAAETPPPPQAPAPVAAPEPQPAAGPPEPIPQAPTVSPFTQEAGATGNLQRPGTAGARGARFKNLRFDPGGFNHEALVQNRNVPVGFAAQFGGSSLFPRPRREEASKLLEAIR